MRTITNATSPIAAALFAVAGGKFTLRGSPEGIVRVLDANGKVIGSAYRIYPDGYAVHTVPYAGYVHDSQITWVS